MEKNPLDPLTTRQKMIIMVVATIAGLLIGWASMSYLGNDNPIEQTVEQLLDAEVEKILNLPEDSVNIDLTPER